jgi:hypothetical protein
MHLYWVTTEDHALNWFVLANSAKDEAIFHEDAEGYAPGDATAEMILKMPDGVKVNTGWPSDKVLKSFGAKCIPELPIRVVETGNRAIHAAKEIQALVDGFSPHYEGKINLTLCMDTGINTGLAVTWEMNSDKGS